VYFPLSILEYTVGKHANRLSEFTISLTDEDQSMTEETMDPANNMPPGYEPAKVWSWDKESGGRFASINRPIAGATHEKELPVGEHPLQLYSLGTPNGVKVTILLEELLALGHTGAEYDAWLINIGEGNQFGSGFVSAHRCRRPRGMYVMAILADGQCALSRRWFWPFLRLRSIQDRVLH